MSEDMNMPDFEEVEWDVSVNAIAKIYLDLRSKGLDRRDAATVVAAILTSREPEGGLPPHGNS